MKEKPGLSFWYDSILVGSLIKYEERKVHHEIVGMMKKQQANLNMSFSCIIFFHRFSLCMSTTSWSFCRWYFFSFLQFPLIHMFRVDFFSPVGSYRWPLAHAAFFLLFHANANIPFGSNLFASLSTGLSLIRSETHTHTQSRTRMRDGIRKCREKKFAHVSWGKLFFPLSNVVSDKLRKVGRGGKWESEGEKRNWKTSIRCVILTIATHPKWSIPNVHVFEHMFGRSLSLCFFRRIAIVHLRAHKNRPFHFPSNSFCTLSHSHDKDVIDNQIKEIHWLKYLPIDDKVSERCSHLLPPAQKKTFFVFWAFGRFGSVKADFNSGCDVNQIRRFPRKPLAELSARRKFLRFSKAV